MTKRNKEGDSMNIAKKKFQT